jgi:ADP-ribose pyrophosphatase
MTLEAIRRSLVAFVLLGRAEKLEAEKQLTSRRVYRGKILDLRVDQVAIPGRGEAIREVVEFHGGGVIAALDDKGRVLLIRQYRYAVDRELWELPAGILEPGEPPAACAARELEEETGYRAARIEPLCSYYTTPGGTNEMLHLFVATGLTPGQARLESDERIEVYPTPLRDARAMIARGEIVDGKTIIGLLLLQAGPSGP